MLDGYGSQRMIVEGNAFGKYGMPSSHTQFMFFFAITFPAVLFMHNLKQQSNKKSMVQFSCLMVASLVAYSRFVVPFVFCC